MTWALIAGFGGIGALLRFELGTFVGARSTGSFPTGTLAVNTVGSLATGLVWALDLPESTMAVLTTGLLGGFTTFSTWMVETGRLLDEDTSPRRAILNLVFMLIGGLMGTVLGSVIGRLIA